LVKKGQKPNFTWPFSKIKKIKGVEKSPKLQICPQKSQTGNPARKQGTAIFIACTPQH